MAGTGAAHLRDHDDVLLRVEDLVVQYRTRSGAKVHAVSGISLDIRRGETLGLVGESGCGKSTTGRAILMLQRPVGGAVVFDGTPLGPLKAREMRRMRARMQMIFQDPMSSLNPRRRIRDIVAEGPTILGQKVDARQVAEALESVGLVAQIAGVRRPHELSGGQCQRVAIARALLVEPDLLVCDEPVSALDVSIQAQILNLLLDLKEQHRLTLVFISHDLAAVKRISDRVAVMYLGRLCEAGGATALYDRPAHPYTQALIESIPLPDPDVELAPVNLSGDLPSPLDPPSGCAFRTRCPRAEARCEAETPTMRAVGIDHFVACHFPTVTRPVTHPVRVL